MSPLHSDCRPKSSLYNVPLSFSLPLASFRSPCPSPRSCVVPKSFSRPDFPTLSLPYSLYLPPQDLLPFQQQWHYRKPRGIIRETLDKIDFTPGHAHRQALPPPPPTHNSSSYSLLLLANSLSLSFSRCITFDSAKFETSFHATLRYCFTWEERTKGWWFYREIRNDALLSSTTLLSLSSPIVFPPFFIRASFPFIPLFYSIPSPPLLRFHAFLSRHFLYPFPPPSSSSFSFFFLVLSFPGRGRELGRSKGTGSNFHRCIRDENPFLVSLLLYFIVLDRMDRVVVVRFDLSPRIGLNRERGWRGIVRIPSGYFTPIRIEFPLPPSFFLPFFLSLSLLHRNNRHMSRGISERSEVDLESWSRLPWILYMQTRRAPGKFRVDCSRQVQSARIYFIEARIHGWKVPCLDDWKIYRISLLFTLRYWGIW